MPKSSVRVIAVRDDPDAEPLDAMLLQLGRRRTFLLEVTGDLALLAFDCVSAGL